MNAHQNIYEALNAVMGQVGYVQKKRTPGLNYSYAGEADLIAAIRPELVANQVVVHPAGVRDLTSEQFTNKNGTVMTRVCGIFAFTFYHGPSQTGFTVEVVGEGVDSGDKAANKAMTAAYKYALRQSLMIETGDDPDQFNSADQERAEQPAAKLAAKPNGGAKKDAPAPQPSAVFPPDDKLMTDLTGPEIYAVQQEAPGKLGLQKNHYTNRYENYYGRAALNRLEGLTVGQFIEQMREPSTGEEPQSELDKHFGDKQAA